VAFPVTFWTVRSDAAPGLEPSPLRSQGPSPFGPRKDRGYAPIAIDPTHVILPRNTGYEIFSVGERRHTLGAEFEQAQEFYRGLLSRARRQRPIRRGARTHGFPTLQVGPRPPQTPGPSQRPVPALRPVLRPDRDRGGTPVLRAGVRLARHPGAPHPLRRLQHRLPPRPRRPTPRLRPHRRRLPAPRPTPPRRRRPPPRCRAVVRVLQRSAV
jgi:hypothetical protein